MVHGATSVYDLRIPVKTDLEVINAVIQQYQRVWHGQKPDQIIFDKRNSDGSCEVRAVVITRDVPKVTLFQVSPNLYVSRL